MTKQKLLVHADMGAVPSSKRGLGPRPPALEKTEKMLTHQRVLPEQRRSVVVRVPGLGYTGNAMCRVKHVKSFF